MISIKNPNQLHYKLFITTNNNYIKKLDHLITLFTPPGKIRIDCNDSMIKSIYNDND